MTNEPPRDRHPGDALATQLAASPAAAHWQLIQQWVRTRESDSEDTPSARAVVDAP